MEIVLLLFVQDFLDPGIQVYTEPARPFEGEPIVVVARYESQFKGRQVRKALTTRNGSHITIAVDIRAGYGTLSEGSIRHDIGPLPAGEHAVDFKIVESCDRSSCSIQLELDSPRHSFTVRPVPARVTAALGSDAVLDTIAADLGDYDVEKREAATDELAYIGRRQSERIFGFIGKVLKHERDLEVIVRLGSVEEALPPVELTVEFGEGSSPHDDSWHGSSEVIRARARNVSTRTVRFHRQFVGFCPFSVRFDAGHGVREKPLHMFCDPCCNVSNESVETILKPGENKEFELDAVAVSGECAWAAMGQTSQRESIPVEVKIEIPGRPSSRAVVEVPLPKPQPATPARGRKNRN